ncbi:MAG: hypothetical protein HPY59_10195 [Anaerolineae bacterium]|nr:hypothetical protein [Anaerolineae bacterium]
MPEKNEPITIFENGWIIRISKPQHGHPARLILLLHGWTGDENSMWLFTHQLKEKFALLAPRAPLRADNGGYGWIDVKSDKWNLFEEFSTAATKLNEQIPTWLKMVGLAENSVLNIMGFSQGAALAYVYTLMYPERIEKVACLAGFLPKNTETVLTPSRLSGKSFFIAHGTRDEIVPINFARQAAKYLQEAGAQVLYCEDEIGHKLSATCFGEINRFFNSPD